MRWAQKRGGRENAPSQEISLVQMRVVMVAMTFKQGSGGVAGGGGGGLGEAGEDQGAGGLGGDDGGLGFSHTQHDSRQFS
eukprot:2313622-Pleurochrysis_carterae.AAC.1